MWICDRLMQEGTTDRRVRSPPPQCSTSREDRQIVCITVTDRSVTSRTMAQHIESVTHHSVSARTVQHRLLQSGLSARHPLLVLPLTQNHRRLRRQWCDERRMWAAEWKKVVFTEESRICLEHHDGRIRVWRHCGERMLNSCVMHCHTSPAPGIMVWGGIGYHSRTPLVHIAENGQNQKEPDTRMVNFRPRTPLKNSCVRYCLTSIIKANSIELLPWPARSPDLSLIENMWPMVAQRLTQIPSPAATPDQLWQCVETAWSAVPQEHIQSLIVSMLRRVAAVISNNGGYSDY
ncbi:transposable element Tc1 transposase [Trichonephila clavipes]|nr:transposable element Tc1 transposase [Trichonephila clavipes]